MQKLIRVEEVVEQILRNDSYARDNDGYLILKFVLQLLLL